MPDFDVGEMTRVSFAVDEDGLIVIEAIGPGHAVRALANRVSIEGGHVEWVLDSPATADSEAPDG